MFETCGLAYKMIEPPKRQERQEQIPGLSESTRRDEQAASLCVFRFGVLGALAVHLFLS